MHRMMALLPALKATNGLVSEMSGPVLMNAAVPSGGLPAAGLRPRLGERKAAVRLN